MAHHRNDKEDLLNAAKVELVNRFILTRSMNRFYAAETFRIFRKKWSNSVFVAGLITFAAGVLGTVFLPSFWKIPGILAILFGLYFLFMSKFGYLYGANLAYKNLEDSLGTPPEMCVTFYPSFFSVKTGDKPLNFYYKQITRRLEYMEMSILIVGTESHIAHGQIIDKAAMEPKDLERYYDVLERAGVIPE